MASDNPATLKVGFIGTGSMGLPIALRLIAAGYALVVNDCNPAARKELEGSAEIVPTARDVADRADVVFACLPTLQACRDVAFGPQGLHLGKRMQTYIHLGTTGAPLVQELVAALAPRWVVDAPITGGAPKARSGNLTSIVSGDAGVLGGCRKLFDAYSSEVIEVSSQPGVAQTMKLVNNIVSATNLAIACEALLVGAKAGLDPAVMVKVLNSGSGQNSATLSKVPTNILTRRFDWGAALSIILKDSTHFLEEADMAGVPVGVARATFESFSRAAEQEGVEADMTTVLRQLERAAGFEMPST